MKFVKFPHIQYYELYKEQKDDYQKFQQFLSDNPDTTWIVTEKIDGSNFGLCVTRCDYQVQKRNSMIETSSQDIWGLYSGKERFKDIVSNIRTKFDDYPNIKQFIFYGEWYGKGIMKRVYYGDDKYYRFFAIYGIDNEDNVISFPFETLYLWLTEWNQLNHLVSIIGIDTDLEHALKCPNDFISYLTPRNSVAEGIVVCPYNKPAIVRFKSKNEQFKEVDNNIEEQTKIFVADEVESLHQQFKSLCTESRMYGIFSKLGMPTNGIKDAAEYIKHFIIDAVDDLKKIEPKYDDLEHRDKKYISGVGKIPFELFKTVYEKLSNE